MNIITYTASFISLTTFFLPKNVHTHANVFYSLRVKVFVSFLHFVSGDGKDDDDEDKDLFTIIIPVICVTIAVACLIIVFVVLRYVDVYLLYVMYVTYCNILMACLKGLRYLFPGNFLLYRKIVVRFTKAFLKFQVREFGQGHGLSCNIGLKYLRDLLRMYVYTLTGLC